MQIDTTRRAKFAFSAFFALIALYVPHDTAQAYTGEYLDYRDPWHVVDNPATFEYLQGYYDGDLSNGFCTDGTSVTHTSNDVYLFDAVYKNYGTWTNLIENPHYIATWQNGTAVPSVQDIANTYGNGQYVLIAVRAELCNGYPYPNSFHGYSSAPNGTSFAWVEFKVINATQIVEVAPDSYSVPVPDDPFNDPLYNIQIVSPTYGETTATTTYNVHIQYKIPLSLDPRPATIRHFEIVDALTGNVDYTYNVNIPANSIEDIDISRTITTVQGSKYLRAMYTTTSGVPYSEVAEIFFNVATNTYKMATGLDNPQDVPADMSQIDCETFDVGCQFQKAMMFLLYPSDTVLNRFSKIWESIATKKPFGYVTVTISELKNLNTTSVHAFDLGTVPFQNEIFTPLKNALGAILWAVFLIYFYQRRLKHLEI